MSFHGARYVRFLVGLISPAVALSAPAGVSQAEIIPLAEMLQGKEVSAAECAAKPQTVWVTADQKNFCIRYYLSNAGGSGSWPIVYLSGDKLGVFNRRTRTFTPGPNDRDIDTAALVKRADIISRAAGTTAIYLARPGIDGSSGHHGARKTLFELHVINAALDAIKKRHRFAGFHLIGQSGGAALVGRLLALRSDLGCAIPGAGPLSWNSNENQSADPAVHYADPSEVIPAIVANRHARLLVVTDPADENVLVERQMAFVRKVRQAGGQVDQFFVQATDREHHGVVSYSILVASECVHRTPTAEISLKLAAYVQRVLARASQAPNGIR